MTLLATAPTTLQVVWFVLVCVLWIGYLVLDGFDYGVAMLTPFLGKTEKERRVIVNTIGPVWDGNQVWLLTAGGATFAAFPGWYATLFSGLYLPLFLILIGLIIRGVSFEYRSKGPDTKWAHTFDWMGAIGSFIVPLVFGVGFANFVIGLPVVTAPGNESLYVVDGRPYFWQLFSPFGLLGGVALVVLFLFHGSIYLSLKTKGSVHDKAKAFARTIGLVAIVGGAVFLVWFQLAYSAGAIGWVTLVLAALGLVAAWYFIGAGRDGLAFIGSAAAIAMVCVMIFARMFPNMGFNSAKVAVPFDITVAASSDSTLLLMTVAAVIFVPIVVGYTAWNYKIFSKRLSTKNMPDQEFTPAP